VALTSNPSTTKKKREENTEEDKNPMHTRERKINIILRTLERVLTKNIFKNED
jgi:hypothetical protein